MTHSSLGHLGWIATAPQQSIASQGIQPGRTGEGLAGTSMPLHWSCGEAPLFFPVAINRMHWTKRKCVLMRGHEHSVKQPSDLRSIWKSTVTQSAKNHFEASKQYHLVHSWCVMVLPSLAHREWNITGQSVAGQEKTQISKQKWDVQSSRLD